MKRHIKHFSKKVIRHRRRIWLWALFFILLAAACSAAYVTGSHTTHITNRELTDIGLHECSRLIVVAHPEDVSEKYLKGQQCFVVCLTEGYNPKKEKEFFAAIGEGGNRGLILKYPDKVHGELSGWAKDKKDIIKDLDTIVNYKQWEEILTHNPDEEKQDIQHQMTCELVTEACSDKYQKNQLYYFD